MSRLPKMTQNKINATIMLKMISLRIMVYLPLQLSKQFVYLKALKPPFVSIVETAQSFMTIQINFFKIPMVVREGSKRKRFS